MLYHVFSIASATQGRVEYVFGQPHCCVPQRGLGHNIPGLLLLLLKEDWDMSQLSPLILSPNDDKRLEKATFVPRAALKGQGHISGHLYYFYHIPWTGTSNIRSLLFFVMHNEDWGMRSVIPIACVTYIKLEHNISGHSYSLGCIKRIGACVMSSPLLVSYTQN